jgi:hypothetical protein
VLDIANFSPIIYIWYEGGRLRPLVVKAVLGSGNSANTLDTTGVATWRESNPFRRK